MAVPVTVNPEAAYATKVNIKFPGSQTQATAAEARAKAVWEDHLPNGITVTIPAGSVDPE